MTRAFPILPGKLNAVARFAGEMQKREEEANCFYRKFGIVRETWDVQSMGDSSFVIVTTEVEDMDAIAEFGPSQEPFDLWFKEQVLELSGVDLSKMPEGHPCEELYRFDAFQLGSS